MQVHILVTGAYGQLGSEINKLATHHKNFKFFFTDKDTLDITNLEAVTSYVGSHKINYIINCAAYTAVDKAEDDLDLCYLINRDAAINLGKAATAHHAKIIHVSTDYVFDGTSTRPYVEADIVNPNSAYGKSKQEGEAGIMKYCPHTITIRTSWLYSTFGNNFVKTMIKLGSERDSLNVVADQKGTPTNAADLAQAILAIIEQSEKGIFHAGIYHYSNEGVSTWYDFTLAIHKYAGITTCQVSPITTSEYPTKAKRPAYSVLDKSKIKNTFGIKIPTWEDSLVECVNELMKK